MIMGMKHSKSKINNKKLKNSIDNNQMKIQKNNNERKRLEKLTKINSRVKPKKKQDKLKKIPAIKTSSGSEPPIQASNIAVIFKDYEHSVAQKLQNQITKSFAHFLLNQIVLSVQIFGNYDDETASALERIFKQENEKNENLDKHSIIFPNALDDAVQKRIQFKPKYGPDKDIQVPLQIQSMYVIFENVEISKSDDVNYDTIPPICKVDIDSKMVGSSKKYKGFLRLRLRESNNQNNQNNMKISSASSNYSTDDSIYMTNHKIPEQYKELQLTPEYETLKLNNFRDSNSSGIDISNDSEYAYITSLNTHHPLTELTNSKSINNGEILDKKALPEYCITIVEYNIDINEETIIESDTESLNDTIQLKYLNSKSFLCYFAGLLKDHLAEKLNLNEIDFQDATWKGASIYTKSYEIIPAIQVQCWPDCAYEWKHRKRPIRINPNNNQYIQWPTPKMIQKIVTFGCHVIPQGHAPKTFKNPYRELEWKIIFPKAERYLETNLTQTQVKVFMLAKTLLKTFLEPQQQKKDTFLFAMDHLRIHLFWQCEENFGGWPDEFLGEVLLRFLRSFLDCTRKKHLPDYFISSRNLFESIPESTLLRVHMVVSQIIENPVMHIMIAYRNLNQVEEFFPKLDYQRIYQIIKLENPLKLQENIMSCMDVNKNYHDDDLDDDDDNKEMVLLRNNKNNDSDDDEEQDNRGLIAYSQKLERRSVRAQMRRVRQRERKMSSKRRKTIKQPEKRISIDSIDLQFIFSTNLEDIERNSKPTLQTTFNNIRRKLAIEIFIKHFLAFAKFYSQLKSLNDSKMYLRQATRLCALLRQLQADVSANKFLINIEKIQKKVELLRCTETNLPPALPKRTSLEPVKFFHLNDTNLRNHIHNNVQEEEKSSKNYVTVSDTKQLSPVRSKSVHFSEPSFFQPVNFVCEAELHEPITILRMNSKESPGKQRKPSVRFSTTIDTGPLISKQTNTKISNVDKEEKSHDVIKSPRILPYTGGGILKQSSVESYNSERIDEINETGKEYSEVFQLRRKAVHKALIRNLSLISNECNENSTDL